MQTSSPVIDVDMSDMSALWSALGLEQITQGGAE